MFHVIPVLKMLVHETYIVFSSSNCEREIFLKLVYSIVSKKKCSCKPILLKEKISDLMQAFTLDTESY